MQVGVFYFLVDFGIDIAELARARCVAGIDRALLEVPDLSRGGILHLLDNHAPLAAAG